MKKISEAQAIDKFFTSTLNIHYLLGLPYSKITHTSINVYFVYLIK